MFELDLANNLFFHPVFARNRWSRADQLDRSCARHIFDPVFFFVKSLRQILIGIAPFSMFELDLANILKKEFLVYSWDPQL